MISTPESGVDSMAVTYALLDPIMTVARPVAAFFSACFAGIMENLLEKDENPASSTKPDLSCPVDSCCSGEECPPEEHAAHHSFIEKVVTGLKYGVTEVWADLAGWFLLGLLIAGIITVFVPKELLSSHLGGGLSSMMLMLAVGIPIYICATASTPVAAALIIKGASPGSALVFLMAGPATNVTSLSVVVGILGKRGTVIYLASIAFCAVIAGLLLDAIYIYFGISAAATAGEASKILPYWLRFVGGVTLLALSIQPVMEKMKTRFLFKDKSAQEESAISDGEVSCSCGCSSQKDQRPFVGKIDLNSIKISSTSDDS